MNAPGKKFSEIQIGDKASFSKTISESDVYLFAGISGDFNPVHVNEEYARKTVFKTRIAHAALAGSLVAPVLGMQLPGPGTVALEVVQRFRKAVFFGDTITCTVQVIKKLERMQAIDMKIIWTNQKGEIVSKGSCRVIPPGSRIEDL